VSELLLRTICLSQPQIEGSDTMGSTSAVIVAEFCNSVLEPVDLCDWSLVTKPPVCRGVETWEDHVDLAVLIIGEVDSDSELETRWVNPKSDNCVNLTFNSYRETTWVTKPAEQCICCLPART